jgi:ketosteroid isomerase-like protein
MSDAAKRLIREWLDMSAMGPADAWDGKVADDLVLRLPYAPPGVLPEMRGLAAARETLSHHWATKRSFEWRDVVIRQTEDPELYVTTTRSEVILMSGEPYANDYIMLTRVRDGKIVEHAEYFNPLPVLAMLKK